MSWCFVSTVQCKTKCLQTDCSEWVIGAFCSDCVHFYCFLLCCVVSQTKTLAFGVIRCFFLFVFFVLTHGTEIVSCYSNGLCIITKPLYTYCLQDDM